MKRCPKCNRTFPDDNQKFCTVDGGSLVAGDQPFDPNATIQGSANLLLPVEAPPEKPVSSRPPDFGETIATPSSAPTVVLPKKTGPTGQPTASNLQPPPATMPAQPPPPSTPSAPPTPVQSATLPPPQQAATLPPSQTAPLPQSQTPQPSQPSPSAPLPPSQTAALPPRASAPLPPTQTTLPPVAAAPAKKKSKLPLILGILAILLVLGVGGAVAAFFLVIKPRLEQMNANRGVVVINNVNENTNANTNENTNTNQPTPEPEKTQPEFVAPPDTTKFANATAGLDAKLAEHYLDFSFYYPNAWTPDPKAGKSGSSNFVRVERRLPPDFIQENFAVGWYTSNGTFAQDEAIFPERVEALSKTLESRFPEYRKVSSGPTKVNSLDGYEFRFTSVSKGTEKGDIQIWGRVIFLPTGVAGEQAGATLIMLATSLAPELASVDDVGAKGQMPVILDSFRFAKAP
jgi:hypothetical protein